MSARSGGSSRVELQGDNTTRKWTRKRKAAYNQSPLVGKCLREIVSTMASWGGDFYPLTHCKMITGRYLDRKLNISGPRKEIQMNGGTRDQGW